MAFSREVNRLFWCSLLDIIDEDEYRAIADSVASALIAEVIVR